MTAPRTDKNYHTHTYRCQHASGDVADYCAEALRQGLRVLGVSDHTALPDNRWAGIRMDIEELPAYVAAIDEAVVEFPGLTVLKAVECEYAVQYDSFFREKLLGELDFDYLVGGTHYFLQDGEWIGAYGGTGTVAGLRAYADHFIRSMESELFAFMAHPDLFGNSYLSWDVNTEAATRDMCAAAASLGVPLEINGYGLRKRQVSTPDGRRPMYPWRPFWEVASEYPVRVLVNSDAHHPKDVRANMDEAARLGAELGLVFADLEHLEQRQGSEPSALPS